VVTEIDRLLDHLTEKEIAEILNERGVSLWRWRLSTVGRLPASAASISSNHGMIDYARKACSPSKKCRIA
jgi:hypothetical protein